MNINLSHSATALIYKLTSILLLVIASALFVHFCIDVKFIQDDAYTSFRYAKNFAEGNGLVYNIGEKVEGYTSFLWVIILAGAINTGLNIVTFAQIFSVFFGVLCLWMTWLISDKIISNITDNYFSRFIFSFLPVVLLLFTGGLEYWSVSAMEFSIFIFLILASIFLTLSNKSKSNRLLAVMLMIATLTRPEGMVFFGMIYLFRIYTLAKDSGKGINKDSFLAVIKNIRVELIIYSLPVIAYLIFRMFYYGYPFPNTFYAKTGFSLYYLERGVRYLLESLSLNTMFGIMVLLPLLLLFRKPVNGNTRFLLILTYIYLLLILFIGGDVLPQHRFILPVLPYIYILFSAALLSLIKNSLLYDFYWLKYGTISLCMMLIVFYSYTNYTEQRKKIYRSVSYEKGLVEKMKIYAEWVNQQAVNSDEEITVCLATIGAFSYYVNARVLDMIGLTDEYIAHNPKEVKGIVDFAPVDWDERRYNVDYVLDRKPDYILFPAGAKPSAYPLVALFSRLEFLNNYYPQLFYSEELNQHMPIFTRRDSTEELWRSSFSQDDCDVKFTKPYIHANNRLLRYIKTGEPHLIDSIKSDFEKVLDYCPAVEAEAKTILGITYFHTDMIAEARALFEDAVKLDKQNCIAHVYLVNIYNDLDMITERNKHIGLLNKYSPDALGKTWMAE